LTEPEIESIEVGGAPACFAPLLRRQPTTALEAKFSMQFCVAVAAVHGDVRMSNFTGDSLNDPAISALMPRITMVPEPKLQVYGENSNAATAAEVRVRFRDGGLAVERIVVPEGEPSWPLSTAAIEAKFQDCTVGVLGAEHAEQALKLLTNLELVTSTREITESLVPQPVSA
jgi:2-methylcitrate dehydratase PrpD